MKKKSGNRLVAAFVALVMVILLLPLGVLAADTSDFEDDSITITYNYLGGTSWDGEAMKTESVPKGEEVYLYRGFENSPNPNQIIVGWCDDAACTGTIYGYHETFDEDITLYAKWADAWNLKIDLGEGSFEWGGNTETYQVAKGDSEFIVIWPDKLTSPSTGLQYAGLYTQPNGKGNAVTVYPYAEPEESYGDETYWRADTLSFTPTSNTTLYAYWAEPITVTYDANGGYFGWDRDITNTVKTVKAMPGVSVYNNAPYPAYKNGYAFVGWATDKDGKNMVDDEQMLKSSVTLYAVWDKGNTVTFNANGGTYSNGADEVVSAVVKGESVGYGYKIPDEAPSENAIFAGWFLDKNCMEEILDIESYVPTKDITLYAGWSKGVRVEYKANGGSFLDENNKAQDSIAKYYAKGSDDVLCLPDELPTGKILEGWYLDNALTKKVDTSFAVMEDTTLYAKWATPVAITFDANGGSIFGKDTETFEVAPDATFRCSDYIFVNPDSDDMIFEGWYADKDLTKKFDINAEISVTQDMTVYAKWVEKTDGLTIRYKVGKHTVGTYGQYGGFSLTAKGDLDADAVNYMVDDDALMDLGLDYKTIGVDTTWYLDKEQTIPLTSSSDVSGNVTVYGNYVKRHAVTFETKGADFYLYTYRGKADDSPTYYFNENTALSNVVDDVCLYFSEIDTPYILEGWSLDESGKQAIGDSKLTSDITLYAVTTPAYRVVFAANGGTWNAGKWGLDEIELYVPQGKNLADEKTQADHLTVDQVLVGDDDIFRYGTDRKFCGWSENEDYSNPIDDIYNYVPSGNMTLYANWHRYGELISSTSNPIIEPTTKSDESVTKPDEPTTEPTTKPSEESTTKPSEKKTKPAEESTTKPAEESTTKSSGNSTTPAAPSEEPATAADGIVKGPDGKWALYKGGKVDTSYTGIAKNEYGWWRVKDGYVDFNANGIYKNEYGWWKTTNGKVTFNETGIFKNEYGWWRVENSKVDFSANGIYKNQYGWWKTTNGKVTFKENGVFKNEYGWWKVENSKVNFKFTGIASNKYGKWYVKNGKVDFSKTGKVYYNGRTYTVVNGKVK